MNNAKRLWCGVVIGAVVLAAGILPAGSQDASQAATDTSALADFSILAVTADDDEKSYKLVPVGGAKIDPAELQSVIKSLPDGFLGIQFSARDYDEDAEVAQCRSACNANNECRQYEYVRPASDRPVGLCRLKRVSEAVGTMAPVADDTSTKAEPLPNAAATSAAPSPEVEEEIPPPPRITKPLVVAFPLPPRAATPLRSTESAVAADSAPPPEPSSDPPTTIVPPPAAAAAPSVEATVPDVVTLPEPSRPPTQTLPPQVYSPTADLPNAEPIPAVANRGTRRGLPLWLALGAVAFMLAGAGVYRHSHQKRMLTRMTARLVSDGLQERHVSVENSEKPDTSLRFVVRNSAAVTAPDTRILAIADGAFA